MEIIHYRCSGQEENSQEPDTQKNNQFVDYFIKRFIIKNIILFLIYTEG